MMPADRFTVILYKYHHPPQPDSLISQTVHPPKMADQTPTLLHRIKWFNFTMLITIPLIAFLCTPRVPLLRPTLIWSLIYYMITMLSITAGTVTPSPSPHYLPSIN